MLTLYTVRLTNDIELLLEVGNKPANQKIKMVYHEIFESSKRRHGDEMARGEEETRPNRRVNKSQQWDVNISREHMA